MLARIIRNGPTCQQALALRGFADQMANAIEGLESLDVNRGIALKALVDEIRAATVCLRALQRYALRKQYETLPREYAHGYEPLSDPQAKRRAVAEP